MTLAEVAAELFTYLVVFRRRIANGDSPRVEAVGHDLDMIFDRMDERAQDDPALEPRYQRRRKILVIVADGVITGSGWEKEKRVEYLAHHLKERQYYHTNTGGVTFFAELDALAPDEPEDSEIFFLALALGFEGKVTDETTRMDRKKKLYRGLPRRLVADQVQLTPQAYHVDSRDCTVAPVARFGRYGIILAGILLLFWVLGHTIYSRNLKDIRKNIEAIESARKGPP